MPAAPCPLCESPTHVRFVQHPGFVVGLAYDIRECEGCGSSFAVDAVPPAGLYATIYEKADRIVGYSRYPQYAKAIEKARDPLEWLAAQEDVYFAIVEMLRAVPKSARILEIGSGLGYLTYALARAGYAAEGWDLSEPAVTAATNRFGPRYKLRDANDIDDTVAGAFDVVIFTSFIEHVDDPIAFLRSVKPLLAPGGAVMLTTDNKTFWNPAPVWQTDLPPVHLYWFTEDGLRTAAERAGFSALFFDYAEYNAERPWERPTPLPLDVPTVGARLDAAGEPLALVMEPEPWRLFPLSRSVIPVVANAVRRATKRFRPQVPIVSANPVGRRNTQAVLLR